MNYLEVVARSKETAWIDRVEAAITAIARATVLTPNPSGDVVLTAQKEYARKVLKDPTYYVERGRLLFALGFQERDNLSPEVVDDTELTEAVLALLAALA